MCMSLHVVAYIRIGPYTEDGVMLGDFAKLYARCSCDSPWTLLGTDLNPFLSWNAALYAKHSKFTKECRSPRPGQCNSVQAHSLHH